MNAKQRHQFRKQKQFLLAGRNATKIVEAAELQLHSQKNEAVSYKKKCEELQAHLTTANDLIQKMKTESEEQTKNHHMMQDRVVVLLMCNDALEEDLKKKTEEYTKVLEQKDEELRQLRQVNDELTMQDRDARSLRQRLHKKSTELTELHTELNRLKALLRPKDEGINYQREQF